MRESNQQGVSFLGLLGLAFIVLKLLGTITWSWWWVTIPLWGPAAIVAAIFLVFGTVFGLKAILDRING